MRRYRLKLKAGTNMDLGVLGNNITVMDSSGFFSVKPDTGSVLEEFEKGITFKSAEIFKKLTFLSETDQTVVIWAGFGDVVDNRVTISGATDTSSKGLNIGSNAYTVTTVSGELLALNAARRSLILMNNDPSYSVWVGGAGVTSSSGLKVSAGQSLVLDNSAGAALHAVANANVSVTIFEELD
jgi:hypothetical protein